MKVAFYLPNKNCHVYCIHVDEGNPGMGGTEYMIIALAYYLSINQKLHSVVLLAQKAEGLPQECNVCQVDNIEGAIVKCQQNEIECLIAQNSPETNSLFKCNLKSLKLIMWGHSFMSRHQWNLYASSKNVKRIVCVGHEELDLYYDHRAALKSTVIFNAFPLPQQKISLIPFDKRQNEVTFLASIVPHTHFHLLAKAWKQVTEKVPDAHLNVIGSGNLYNKNKNMGRFGIASSEYESTFMPYLLDESGKILSSVTFWGKLGNEKYEILNRTKVGVANPGGYETFCISAIELQLYGAKLVSCKKGGLLDTVYDENYLFSNPNDLAEFIIKVLKAKKHNYEDVLSFLHKNFSFNVICLQWVRLLNDVENDIPQNLLELHSKNVTFGHRFRRFNKKLKSYLPYGYYILPSYMFYKTVLNRIKSIFVCNH